VILTNVEFSWSFASQSVILTNVEFSWSFAIVSLRYLQM
jgi:hypothetical protein